MQKQYKKSIGNTLVLTLGLGLTGCLSATAVLAQAPPPGATASEAVRQDLDPSKGPVDMDNDPYIRDERDAPEPEAEQYPYAAPGTLHLYHYTDTTHWTVRQGSAQERRDQIRRIVAIRRMEERRRYIDLLPADERGDQYYATHEYPLAEQYPYAASGTLALYHWTDYTKWGWGQGSPDEILDRRMRREDEKIHNELLATDQILGINEDEYEKRHAEPEAEQYPYAANGTLALYHWTDYTQWNWAQGSVDEARDMMIRKEDQRRREEIERDNQILGYGRMRNSQR